NYDAYPSDFMLLYYARYGNTQPVLQIDVLRPDGKEFRIYFASLPPAREGGSDFSARVFATDRTIEQNLRAYQDVFSYRQDPSRPQVMIFSNAQENKVLKGTYVVHEKFFLFE